MALHICVTALRPFWECSCRTFPWSSRSLGPFWDELHEIKEGTKFWRRV